MERRYSMTFFCEEYKGGEDPEVNAFYLEGDKMIYGGREILLQDKKVTYYVLPIEEHEALLFLNVGDGVFDDFLNNIDEYNEQGLRNAFPLFMKSVENGLNENFSSTALLNLPHACKDGKFWCFATKIENIDLSDLENDYVLNKLMKLYSETIDILNQLENSNVDFWDKAKGAGKAAYDGWKWARRALVLGGLFFGVDLGGE